MAWLGRYRNLLPIRARDSFHVFGAETGDGPAVVVTASPRAEVEAARRALAAFATAHRTIDHPWVPRTRRAGPVEGTDVVELACDAVIDGEEFLRLFADSELRLPYGVADAFITGVREALQGGHSAGYCLGRLAYGNVLFSPTGKINLIGFGHNVIVEKENGAVNGSASVFQAPELDVDGDRTPDGDYVALLHLMRAVAPYVDMVEPVARVLRGRPSGTDAELVSLMSWYDRAFFGTLPHERPSMAEGIAVSARIREILDEPLDHGKRERYFAKVLEDADATTEAPADREGELVVHAEGQWFVTPDGVKRSLGPRKALRRVLLALVARRLEGGKALTPWEVLAAGWPGEEPLYEAALNRVYVTIARLRSMGLGKHLERFEDGYRLSSVLAVQIAR